MLSPTKLLIAAAITASAVGAGPAVAGACGWGYHPPPPHHRHHCPTTSTTGSTSTSTSSSTTSTING